MHDPPRCTPLLLVTLLALLWCVQGEEIQVDQALCNAAQPVMILNQWPVIVNESLTNCTIQLEVNHDVVFGSLVHIGRVEGNDSFSSLGMHLENIVILVRNTTLQPPRPRVDNDINATSTTTTYAFVTIVGNTSVSSFVLSVSGCTVNLSASDVVVPSAQSNAWNGTFVSLASRGAPLTNIKILISSTSLYLGQFDQLIAIWAPNATSSNSSSSYGVSDVQVSIGPSVLLNSSSVAPLIQCGASQRNSAAGVVAPTTTTTTTMVKDLHLVVGGPNTTFLIASSSPRLVQTSDVGLLHFDVILTGTVVSIITVVVEDLPSSQSISQPLVLLMWPNGDCGSNAKCFYDASMSLRAHSSLELSYSSANTSIIISSTQFSPLFEVRIDQSVQSGFSTAAEAVGVNITNSILVSQASQLIAVRGSSSNLVNVTALVLWISNSSITTALQSGQLHNEVDHSEGGGTMHIEHGFDITGVEVTWTNSHRLALNALLAPLITIPTLYHDGVLLIHVEDCLFETNLSSNDTRVVLIDGSHAKVDGEGLINISAIVLRTTFIVSTFTTISAIRLSNSTSNVKLIMTNISLQSDDLRSPSDSYDITPSVWQGILFDGASSVSSITLVMDNTTAVGQIGVVGACSGVYLQAITVVGTLLALNQVSATIVGSNIPVSALDSVISNLISDIFVEVRASTLLRSLVPGVTVLSYCPQKAKPVVLIAGGDITVYPLINRIKVAVVDSDVVFSGAMVGLVSTAPNMFALAVTQIILRSDVNLLGSSSSLLEISGPGPISNVMANITMLDTNVFATTSLSTTQQSRASMAMFAFSVNTIYLWATHEGSTFNLSPLMEDSASVAQRGLFSLTTASAGGEIALAAINLVNCVVNANRTTHGSALVSIGGINTTSVSNISVALQNTTVTLYGSNTSVIAVMANSIVSFVTLAVVASSSVSVFDTPPSPDVRQATDVPLLSTSQIMWVYCFCSSAVNQINVINMQIVSSVVEMIGWGSISTRATNVSSSVARVSGAVTLSEILFTQRVIFTIIYSVFRLTNAGGSVVSLDLFGLILDTTVGILDSQFYTMCATSSGAVIAFTSINLPDGRPSGLYQQTFVGISGSLEHRITTDDVTDNTTTSGGGDAASSTSYRYVWLRLQNVSFFASTVSMTVSSTVNANNSVAAGTNTRPNTGALLTVISSAIEHTNVTVSGSTVSGLVSKSDPNCVVCAVSSLFLSVDISIDSTKISTSGYNLTTINNGSTSLTTYFSSVIGFIESNLSSSSLELSDSVEIDILWNDTLNASIKKCADYVLVYATATDTTNFTVTMQGGASSRGGQPVLLVEATPFSAGNHHNLVYRVQGASVAESCQGIRSARPTILLLATGTQAPPYVTSLVVELTNFVAWWYTMTSLVVDAAVTPRTPLCPGGCKFILQNTQYIQSNNSASQRYPFLFDSAIQTRSSALDGGVISVQFADVTFTTKGTIAVGLAQPDTALVLRLAQSSSSIRIKFQISLDNCSGHIYNAVNVMLVSAQQPDSAHIGMNHCSLVVDGGALFNWTRYSTPSIASTALISIAMDNTNVTVLNGDGALFLMPSMSPTNFPPTPPTFPDSTLLPIWWAPPASQLNISQSVFRLIIPDRGDPVSAARGIGLVSYSHLNSHTVIIYNTSFVVSIKYLLFTSYRFKLIDYGEAVSNVSWSVTSSSMAHHLLVPSTPILILVAMTSATAPSVGPVGSLQFAFNNMTVTNVHRGYLASFMSLGSLSNLHFNASLVVFDDPTNDANELRGLLQITGAAGQLRTVVTDMTLFVSDVVQVRRAGLPGELKTSNVMSFCSFTNVNGSYWSATVSPSAQASIASVIPQYNATQSLCDTSRVFTIAGGGGGAKAVMTNVAILVMGPTFSVVEAVVYSPDATPVMQGWHVTYTGNLLSWDPPPQCLSAQATYFLTSALVNLVVATSLSCEDFLLIMNSISIRGVRVLRSYTTNANSLLQLTRIVILITKGNVSSPSSTPLIELGSLGATAVSTVNITHLMVQVSSCTIHALDGGPTPAASLLGMYPTVSLPAASLFVQDSITVDATTLMGRPLFTIGQSGGGSGGVNNNIEELDVPDFTFVAHNITQTPPQSTSMSLPLLAFQQVNAVLVRAYVDVSSIHGGLIYNRSRSAPLITLATLVNSSVTLANISMEVRCSNSSSLCSVEAFGPPAPIQALFLSVGGLLNTTVALTDVVQKSSITEIIMPFVALQQLLPVMTAVLNHSIITITSVTLQIVQDATDNSLGGSLLMPPSTPVFFAWATDNVTLSFGTVVLENNSIIGMNASSAIFIRGVLSLTGNVLTRALPLSDASATTTFMNTVMLIVRGPSSSYSHACRAMNISHRSVEHMTIKVEDGVYFNSTQTSNSGSAPFTTTTTLSPSCFVCLPAAPTKSWALHLSSGTTIVATTLLGWGDDVNMQTTFFSVYVSGINISLDNATVIGQLLVWGNNVAASDPIYIDTISSTIRSINTSPSSMSDTPVNLLASVPIFSRLVVQWRLNSTLLVGFSRLMTFKDPSSNANILLGCGNVWSHLGRLFASQIPSTGAGLDSFQQIACFPTSSASRSSVVSKSLMLAPSHTDGLPASRSVTILFATLSAINHTPSQTFPIERPSTPTGNNGVSTADGGAVLAVGLPIGSFLGTAGGMWALRSVALMRLAACDFDLSDQLDLASNPTRLGFGVESGRYLRGSVIGNAALILGICLGALLLTLARMRIGPRGRQQLSLRRAASLLSLPGWLLVPFGLVMQPTLSSAVSLLKYSPGGAGDVALGIAGLVFCIAPLFYCAEVLLRRFRATSVLAIDVGIPMTREPLWRAWRWLMWRKYAWVEAAAGAHFVERYEVLFDGYRPRRHWFGLVEMSVTVVCGVLTGLLPIDPGSNCVDLLAAMCAANTALLLTFFALRPLETRVEVGAALLNYACGALWGPLVLTDRFDDAQRCATAQVWLQVVLLGLLVVRIVLNGVLLRAVRRFGSATAAFVRGTEFDMGRFDLDVSFKRTKTFRQNDYFSKVAEEKLEVAAAIDDGKDGESGAATKINGTQRSHQVLKKQVADETSSKPVGALPQQRVVGTTDGVESYQERHLQISNQLKDLLPPKTRSAQLKTLRLLISVIALDRKRARFNTAKKLLLKQ